jgi:hypothetical protein
MSIVDTIKSFIAPPEPALKVISVNSASNYEELPQGFFQVVTASGKKSLGYNGSFLAWEVGATVVDGGRRITLDVPREQLPIVNLNFQRQTDGVQVVGGHSFIDTDALESFSGEVAWEGAKPPTGVDHV